MLDNNLSDEMKALSEGIKQDRQKAGKQAVIVNIDWRGAVDASWYRDPQQTDHWIRPTAEEAFKKLSEWGATEPSKINLVGHSMGTMVVNEIARQYNLEYNQSVNRIYYTDPPNYWPIRPSFNEFRVDDRYGKDNQKGASKDAIYREGHGYTVHARANIQRAFTGTNSMGDDGLCGNTPLAMTAKEYLDFGFTDINVDFIDGCPAHGSPNYAFSKILQFEGFNTANNLTLNQGNITSETHGYTYSANKHGYIFVTDKKQNATPQNLTIKENNKLIQYGFKDRGNQFSNFNSELRVVSDKIPVTISNFDHTDDRISLQRIDIKILGDTPLIYTSTYTIFGNKIKRKIECREGQFPCGTIPEFDELVVEGDRVEEDLINNPQALDPTQNIVIYR